jgi:hypothetical protein
MLSETEPELEFLNSIPIQEQLKEIRLFLTNSSNAIKYIGYLNRALNRINGIAEGLISAATLNTSTTEGLRRRFIKFKALRL